MTWGLGAGLFQRLAHSHVWRLLLPLAGSSARAETGTAIYVHASIWLLGFLTVWLLDSKGIIPRGLEESYIAFCDSLRSHMTLLLPQPARLKERKHRAHLSMEECQCHIVRSTYNLAYIGVAVFGAQNSAPSSYTSSLDFLTSNFSLFLPRP